MKNPKWHRDEIILALDLYFNPERGIIDASNPNIIELSQILNKLPIFPNKPDEEKFRNPNGVSLKLSNFLAIDPTYEGKGMSSYSRLDKEVFEEFHKNLNRLNKVVNQIKSIVKDDSIRQKLYKIEEDETSETDEVLEGQVLYRFHKYRERNSKIVSKKKKSVLKSKGKLFCEVCEFDFHKTYGSIGYGFIECHHIKPISENTASETKFEDLALVCSNCHRMLHRKISVLSIIQLKKIMEENRGL
jgi:5-methylcytosine-specific restriction protein A